MKTAYGFIPRLRDIITMSADMLDGFKPEAMDNSTHVYAVEDSHKLSYDIKMDVDAQLTWRLIKRNDIYLTSENKTVEAYQFMCIQTSEGVVTDEEFLKEIDLWKRC